MNYIKSTLSDMEIERGTKYLSPLFDFQSKIVIAGGAARYILSPVEEPAPCGDIDIYCKTSNKEEAIEDYNSICSYLNENSKKKIDKFKPIKGHFAKTFDCFGNKYQVIYPIIEMGGMKTYGDPESIIERFDFSVVSAAIYDYNKTIRHCLFDKDETEKRLRVVTLRDNVTAFRNTKRYVKYGLKGYKAGLDDVLRMVSSCEKENRSFILKLENYDDIRKCVLSELDDKAYKNE